MRLLPSDWDAWYRADNPVGKTVWHFSENTSVKEGMHSFDWNNVGGHEHDGLAHLLQKSEYQFNQAEFTPSFKLKYQERDHVDGKVDLYHWPAHDSELSNYPLRLGEPLSQVAAVRKDTSIPSHIIESSFLLSSINNICYSVITKAIKDW